MKPVNSQALLTTLERVLSASDSHSDALSLDDPEDCGLSARRLDREIVKARKLVERAKKDGVR